ncbi:MAG: addiction module antidote protein, HigA family, partial [Armatimonadetes bacterium CG_4_10_14_3_um_filter_66_18]
MTHRGERLREAFVKPLGVSQSALASRLGVPRQRLGQLLRGQSTITADTALRLARVVGMSADSWLGPQQDR